MFRSSIALAMAFLTLLAIGAPAHSASYLVNITGSIQSAQGDLSSGAINIGDPVTGQFMVDLDAAIFGATNPIGGGYGTSYAVELTEFDLRVGEYKLSAPRQQAIIYYHDGIFGSDSFGFVLDGLPGGPFGSEFASVQFQARGDQLLLAGSTSSNGLPFDVSTNSLFAGFGGPSGNVRLFGPLNVTATIAAVPEPGTWLMMLFGFASIGVALRSYRGYSSSPSTLKHDR